MKVYILSSTYTEFFTYFYHALMNGEKVSVKGMVQSNVRVRQYT